MHLLIHILIKKKNVENVLNIYHQKFKKKKKKGSKKKRKAKRDKIKSRLKYKINIQ